jgi:hypothetical protein
MARLVPAAQGPTTTETSELQSRIDFGRKTLIGELAPYHLTFRGGSLDGQFFRSDSDDFDERKMVDTYWDATGGYPLGGFIDHPNPLVHESSVYRITESNMVDARIFVVATFVGSGPVLSTSDANAESFAPFVPASAQGPAKSAARWGLIAAWVWTILSGGGGALLLVQRGPWPLTNGWFALFSGLAACPFSTWLANRTFGVSVSGRTRFTAAALIWLAGQIARRMAT